MKHGGLGCPPKKRKFAGLKSDPESFTKWRQERGGWIMFCCWQGRGPVQRRRVVNLQLLFISD